MSLCNNHQILKRANIHMFANYIKSFMDSNKLLGDDTLPLLHTYLIKVFNSVDLIHPCLYYIMGKHIHLFSYMLMISLLQVMILQLSKSH